MGTFPFLMLLILSLPLFFGDDDYIGDDVWILHISFNSTLESLPYLCSPPLTGNSFTIDRLGNLPVSCVLDLIPSTLSLCFTTDPFLVFAIKRHRRLSVLLTSGCFLLL
jgi:hypothetical protein